MSALLEVICLHEHDARRAEEGGADRIELLGAMEHAGLSPEPALVAKVRAATSVQLRVMVRLREGFGTDGGEFVRLRGLISSYLDAGADGVVLGFLNALEEVDEQVCAELVDGGDFGWTFHRAIDQALDTDKAWRAIKRLPRVDQVLTAGSARDVEHGLDELLARCRNDPDAARLMMVGGGLQAEHVPWLVRAGVRAFHIGRAARPLGQYKAYVDAPLVQTWRELLDDEVRRVSSGR